MPFHTVREFSYSTSPDVTTGPRRRARHWLTAESDNSNSVPSTVFALIVASDRWTTTAAIDLNLCQAIVDSPASTGLSDQSTLTNASGWPRNLDEGCEYFEDRST